MDPSRRGALRLRTSGTGKSHLVEALGHLAIDGGKTVAWPKTLATATVDRLLHHAHVLLTDGTDSYRLARATAGKGVTPSPDPRDGENQCHQRGETCPPVGRFDGRRWGETGGR
jgi:hypothetical protein